jgi:hypothetical protein
MTTANGHALAPAVRVRGDGVADAYDYAGDGYGRYADGEPLEDSATEADCSAHHADTIVWATICQAIDHAKNAGLSTLRVLDAGCGPGTWIRRVLAV